MSPAEPEPEWPTCAADGCIGIRLPAQERCLAHVEERVREGFLAKLRPGADIDLRGTPISADLLAWVVGPLKEHGRPRLGSARFDRAKFSGDAWFREAQFSGDAGFDGTQFSRYAGFGEAQFSRYAGFRGAKFSRDAWFDRAKFSGDAGFGEAQFSRYAGFGEAHFGGYAGFDEARFSRNAWFRDAQFGGDAGFDGAKFSGNAWFGEAQFSGNARFGEAQFNGDAWFDRAKFSGDAWFREAQFSRYARFDGAQFSRYARFDGARFGGNAGFDEAKFSGDAWFREAQFSAARVFGPLIAESQFSLSHASFSAPILIEVAARQLVLVSVAFQEAVTLRLRFAETVLDGTSFPKPSTIAFAEFAFADRTGNELKEEALVTSNRHARPRLLSLRLVDVSNLVLANLDLSICLFQGAHNLEKVRIEGPVRFGPTPGSRRVRVGRSWVPIWRPWVRRQTLAEEHLLRVEQSRAPRGDVAGRPHRPGWNPPDWQRLEWVKCATGQPVQRLAPENLAALYRALRKGLEDQKNAPAASDFYYGEMEMRRISPTSPWADRFLLWVYWLFSGYGLRASRALLAIAILVPLFAIGFWLWGLDPDQGHPVSYPTALLRSLESATSLLRPSPPGLNQFGQLLDAVLRLIGATLLGLALFSLRGRIKR